METSTQIIVKYRENKINDFDKIISEVAHKCHGVRVFGGKRKLSINDHSISTFKTTTFKFPDKDSMDTFVSELNEFDGITFEENPWLKMAGMHKNNPLFEEVVAYMESNRQINYEEQLS